MKISQVPLLVDEVFTIYNFWSWKNDCFEECGMCYTDHTPVNALTSMSSWVSQTGHDHQLSSAALCVRLIVEFFHSVVLGLDWWGGEHLYNELLHFHTQKICFFPLLYNRLIVEFSKLMNIWTSITCEMSIIIFHCWTPFLKAEHSYFFIHIFLFLSS